MFEISADWHKNAKFCTRKQACSLLDITFEQELMSGEAAKERVTPVPSKS